MPGQVGERLRVAAPEHLLGDRPAPIVTSIEPLGEVYPAPEEHQDFFAKNPTQGYCLAVAVPKVNKVRAAFSEYLG